MSNTVLASRDSVVAKLLEMLRAKTHKAGEDWNEDTTLADAGIDSFDVVEYVFDIEDAFGIEIDFNANQTQAEMKTVGDMARIILAQLDHKAAA